MKRRIVRIASIILGLCGIILVFYPLVSGYVSNNKATKIIKEYKQQTVSSDTLEEFYQDIINYNQDLYLNQQVIQDPFVYESSAFDLSDYNIEDSIIGYLTIPTMDIELPIYLGATTENLSLGAANLGNTSMPIGGINTNAVLAAHRGYRGQAMFRDIEALSLGDKIYITNYWATLTYEVVETKVILPSDVSEINIQENKDMVTLITCHPYTKNYQRYVVYCERVVDEEIPNLNNQVTKITDIFDYQNLSESKKIIYLEKYGLYGILVIIILILSLFTIVSIKKRKH